MLKALRLAELCANPAELTTAMSAIQPVSRTAERLPPPATKYG
jgi:hypothetical protein